MPPLETLIKVGVVGGGSTSAVGNAHLSALALVPGVVVEASFHSTVDPEGRIQSLLPTSSRLYPSLESFIQHEQGKLDWVVVLSPSTLHYAQTLALLEGKFNVISEKPMAQSSVEVNRLFNLAISSGLKLHGIQNYVGFPALAALKMLVREGEIGEVLHVKSEMLQQGYVREISGKLPRPQDWRFVDSPLPMILLDLGIHAVHLALLISARKPKRVTMIKSFESPRLGLCTSSIILGDSDRGTTFEINVSKGRLGKSNSLGVEIFGSRGSLTWKLEDPESVRHCGADGRVSLFDRQILEEKFPELVQFARFKSGHPVGFVEALANYYQAILFSEGITKESAIAPATANDILDTLRILEVANLSSETGKWEPIDEAGPSTR